jgi:hypothetical protein
MKTYNDKKETKRSFDTPLIISPYLPMVVVSFDVTNLIKEKGKGK